MAIKMRVNKNKDSECDECNVLYKNTLEMYDIMLCGKVFTLCYDCMSHIFHKSLKLSCMYDSRIKDKEDIKRRLNYNKSKGR